MNLQQFEQFLTGPAAVPSLLLLVVALFALVALLLVALLFRSPGRKKIASSLAKALDEAMDRNADNVEARQNRLEMRLGRDFDSLRQGVDAIRRETVDRLDRSSEGGTKTLLGLSNNLSEGIAALNDTLSMRLAEMQKTNDEKLERMRETVGENLQTTLEKRISQSFDSVLRQLVEIEKGLGEVQGLAANVDSLRRVMGNVKTRGVFGEAQLGAILSEILAPGQYAENVETVPGSGKRVEFAVRLPGAGRGEQVWLPIDAKFPLEDWNRLEEARVSGDRDMGEAAAKALRTAVLGFARDIATKYVKVPHTTEFAVMFLPTESLYAEVLGIPGLADEMMRRWRVTPAGPAVAASLLNSLRMGFRTLAIQERSAEVWRLLGVVKGEFRNFAEALDAVGKRLDQAGEAVGRVRGRTERIGRSLGAVEELPAPPAADGPRDPARPS